MAAFLEQENVTQHKISIPHKAVCSVNDACNKLQQ